MRVAESMDEVADLQPAFARDEMGQQGVTGDVERHAEEEVGRALIELAGEPAIDDVELKQAVAGRQLHPLDVG